VSEHNVELIRRSFLAWAETGELDLSLLDDDVEVHDHDILDASEYRGREGFARWFENWGEVFPEFEVQPEEFIDAGERVVVVLRMVAKGRGSSATVERRDAIVYELFEGKVRRIDYYNSREQGLAAAGLSASA
jgi:ketosteroid isomerase-like protein